MSTLELIKTWTCSSTINIPDICFRRVVWIDFLLVSLIFGKLLVEKLSGVQDCSYLFRTLRTLFFNFKNLTMSR